MFKSQWHLGMGIKIVVSPQIKYIYIYMSMSLKKRLLLTIEDSLKSYISDV